MSNKALVDFSQCRDLSTLPADLHKELRTVQSQLNLAPTVKDKGGYVASPTNIAVMEYWELTFRLIGKMVEQGLSYSAGDYYVYVQFGGKPNVTKSPNGMIKGIAKLASKQGYIANINVGCIFEGYEELSVTRDGQTDSINLTNNPEAEVMDAEILAPFTVITLIQRESRELISRKVTIVRNGEYKNAKSQGSATHKYYPVPMAQKIALKRAAEEMAASLGIDDSVDLEQLRGEISDHNAEYDLSVEPKSAAENSPKRKPDYPAERYGENLSKWHEAISSGESTPADIIKSINGRFTLSVDQKLAIEQLSELPLDDMSAIDGSEAA